MICILLIFFPTLLYSQKYLNKEYDIISLTFEIYNQLNNQDPYSPISREEIDKIIAEIGKIYGFPDIENIPNEEEKEEIRDSIVMLIKEWNPPIWNLIGGKVDKMMLETRSSIIDRVFFNIIPELISLKSSESLQYFLYTTFINNLLSEDELKVMFPLTSRTIDKMDRLKVTLSPKALSESFKTDLAGLPKNFPAIFKLPKYRSIVDKNPHLLLFSSASDYYKSIISFESIDNANYKLFYNLSKARNGNIYSNLHSSFLLFNELCRALKGKTYSEIEEIKNNLEKGDRFILLLMGVFCAKNNDVFFISNKEVTSSVRAGNDASYNIKTRNAYNVPIIVGELVQEERIYEFRNYFNRFADMYYDCITTLDTIKYFTYYGYGSPIDKEVYFDKVLDFIEFGFDPRNYNSNFDYYDYETKKFLDLLKYYREIDDNIKKDKYFAALMNSLYAYEDICSVYLSADSSFEVSKNFFTTVKVIGELTSADNDNDIAKVLNNYIFSSVNSYSKKELPFSININSYLGYYYGKEAEKVTNNWTQNRGITAPIGLEFSFGLKNWGSLGLYVPVLDIGAIMDFKLNYDSTETVPDIRFENIISPGLYVVYGLPKIPFTFGGGVQYSPQLGKIRLEGKTIEPRKLRWNVFIAFDLPLLNLFKNEN